MHDAFRNIVTWPYGILQRVSLAWPYYFSKQTSDSANVGGCTFRSCLPKASSHVHPSLPQCLQSVLPWGSGRVHLMGLIIIYVEWFKSLLKPPISIHWCEIHPGVFLMRGFRCAASLPRLDGGDGDPFPGKLFELGILHICLYLYAVTGKNWYKYKWFPCSSSCYFSSKSSSFAAVVVFCHSYFRSLRWCPTTQSQQQQQLRYAEIMS